MTIQELFEKAQEMDYVLCIAGHCDCKIVVGKNVDEVDISYQEEFHGAPLEYEFSIPLYDADGDDIDLELNEEGKVTVLDTMGNPVEVELFQKVSII